MKNAKVEIENWNFTAEMHPSSTIKLQPVEAIVLLVIVILFIFFFDKLVVRRDKPHHSSTRHARNIPLAKRAWHSFLWMVEIFTSLYFYRTINPGEEPFRRATLTEKRYGSCFMTLVPLLGISVSRYSKSIDALADSFMYVQRSMLWFYLGFIAFAVVAGVFITVIAPKIPLFVSAPMAIASWLALAWLGFTGQLVH